MLLSWELRKPMEKSAPCHLGCEVENPKGFHAVWRDRVLVVNDSDVAKPERLDQMLARSRDAGPGGAFPLPLVWAPVLVLRGQWFGRYSQ